MLNVFTNGMPGDYVYQGQYLDCFSRTGLRALVREVHYPDADHVFSGLEQQRRVIQLVGEWLEAVPTATATPSLQQERAAVSIG
jgi:hypothetical protein